MPIITYKVTYQDEIIADDLEEAKGILLEQLSRDVQNRDVEAFDIRWFRSEKTPYEQGRADSYYRRGKFIASRGDEPWTAEEVAEYLRGYEENEQAGDFKEWRPGYSIEGEKECMQ